MLVLGTATVFLSIMKETMDSIWSTWTISFILWISLKSGGNCGIQTLVGCFLSTLRMQLLVLLAAGHHTRCASCWELWWIPHQFINKSLSKQIIWSWAAVNFFPAFYLAGWASCRQHSNLGTFGPRNREWASLSIATVCYLGGQSSMASSDGKECWDLTSTS